MQMKANRIKIQDRALSLQNQLSSSINQSQTTKTNNCRMKLIPSHIIRDLSMSRAAIKALLKKEINLSSRPVIMNDESLSLKHLAVVLDTKRLAVTAKAALIWVEMPLMRIFYKIKTRGEQQAIILQTRLTRGLTLRRTKKTGFLT